MGFLSALFGGSVGFLMQCSANSALKLPVARYPWRHALFFGIGLYVGDQYPKVEAEMMDELNAIRAAKGMPPLVPSKKWLGVEPASS
mmetsp:Transcript_7118/g.19923  ORF Transcript_7118/g.19923 Transcript_7118/m.19923 type:complete len:87 (+) Transcript_7118:80-340(+)